MESQANLDYLLSAVYTLQSLMQKIQFNANVRNNKKKGHKKRDFSFILRRRSCSISGSVSSMETDDDHGNAPNFCFNSPIVSNAQDSWVSDESPSGTTGILEPAGHGLGVTSFFPQSKMGGRPKKQTKCETPTVVLHLRGQTNSRNQRTSILNIMSKKCVDVCGDKSKLHGSCGCKSLERIVGTMKVYALDIADRYSSPLTQYPGKHNVRASRHSGASDRSSVGRRLPFYIGNNATECRQSEKFTFYLILH